ncbi:hypothetical protein PA0131 [Candidatus Phytoplasma australiense]|uniref:Uncharacterized protein n=1 Tax=Phytoplasma australiense TaxID=59748 RepID=B1V934_PHYAS|nr:hypothetical protein PA0131 [Candidatus Phytoplasma australiense]
MYSPTKIKILGTRDGRINIPNIIFVVGLALPCNTLKESIIRVIRKKSKRTSGRIIREKIVTKKQTGILHIRVKMHPICTAMSGIYVCFTLG